MVKNILFGNVKLLDEKSSIKDLLLFSDEAENVTQHIDRLVEKKSHSVIAYLGNFGAGKTTVLKEVKQRRDNFKWITFEIWRYTNRQEIWDGFVIKLASEILGKSEFKIADEIEGDDMWGIFDRLKLAFGLLIYIAFTLTVGFVIYKIFSTNSQLDLFMRAFFKYATPSVIALGALLGLGAYLRLRIIQVKRPLRRLLELEVFLNKTLKKAKQPIIIVIEDVDRTGFDGSVFLETLSNFIKINLKDFKQPFIVIAPQTKTAFEAINHDNGVDSFEQSLKIYDEHISFKSFLTNESINKLYEELDVSSEYFDKLNQATKIIIQTYRQNISIRLLKYSLREVNKFIDNYPDGDPVVALIIILSKYIPIDLNPNGLSKALNMISNGSSHGNGLSCGFFRALTIAANEDYQDSNNVNAFVIHFTQQTKEIVYKKSLHHNGSIIGRLNVDIKYQTLIQ